MADLVSESVTVYVTIGNSDDKLTQREWAMFTAAVSKILHGAARSGTMHGEWSSLPNAPWQNACWCLSFIPDEEVVSGVGERLSRVDWLRRALARLAVAFRQDSIAWAEARAEFITPDGGVATMNND